MNTSAVVVRQIPILFVSSRALVKPGQCVETHGSCLCINSTLLVSFRVTPPPRQILPLPLPSQLLPLVQHYHGGQHHYRHYHHSNLYSPKHENSLDESERYSLGCAVDSDDRILTGYSQLHIYYHIDH